MSKHADDKIIRLAVKDPNAFGVLYDRYYTVIFRFVLSRTGSESLTKDIVSQTFLKAMTNIDKYQFKGHPFSSWLYRIATNQIHDFYRKSQKNQTVELDEGQLRNLTEELVEDGFDVNMKQMVEALNTLDAVDSDLLDLKFFERLSHQDIASIYGKSEAAVKQKIHRVLGKVRKMIKFPNLDQE